MISLVLTGKCFSFDTFQQHGCLVLFITGQDGLLRGKQKNTIELVHNSA